MLLSRVKRLILGEPLSNQMAAGEKLSKRRALAVLSSDALSSTAYATEEMLIPLVAFAGAAAVWGIPIAALIVTLLLIVAVSYRQTVTAYPSGGGAYVVSRENLGKYPSLVAGASLLIDYILTVSVSVAAGVANITSAFPALLNHQVALAVFFIAVLTVGNLRGLRESSSFFAYPTYFFIILMGVMILYGGGRLLIGADVATRPFVEDALPAVPLFLLLRAFSSGCTALTGIEAISNAVEAFREPAEANAKKTLTTMSIILVTIFAGVTVLAHYHGIAPRETHETVISLLSRRVFGDSVLYYATQVSVALILLLAANTSYTGFPILASFLARDRFLPRQLGSVGDRLVFSNGIVGLSFAATALVVLYDADTHHLIPLYAVGVFLSFTLAQTGLVVHHLREKKLGWKWGIFINSVGGVSTGVVLCVIAVTKFLGGAWLVVLLIPAMVFLFQRINLHYTMVSRELTLAGVTPEKSLAPVRHTVIVPISGIHRGVLDALRYAISISKDVRACYVELDAVATERMREEWKKWAHEIPFVVLKSPYRSVIRPLLEYIDDCEKITGGELITVIIPEFVTAKWRHQFLHNQTALLIRAALMFRKGKVVTSVRYHLKET